MSYFSGYAEHSGCGLWLCSYDASCKLVHFSMIPILCPLRASRGLKEIGAIVQCNHAHPRISLAYSNDPLEAMTDIK